MTYYNPTASDIAALQSELERSRTDLHMLVTKTAELASAFGILRTVLENEPGPAADLAHILEEYTYDLVDAAARKSIN